MPKLKVHVQPAGIEGLGVLNKEASAAYQNLSHLEKEQLKQKLCQRRGE